MYVFLYKTSHQLEVLLQLVFLLMLQLLGTLLIQCNYVARLLHIQLPHGSMVYELRHLLLSMYYMNLALHMFRDSKNSKAAHEPKKWAI